MTKNDITVNFHLTKKCNYRCKYCYAHFSERSELTFEQRSYIVREIADNGFSKLNFAGGEPFLCSHLGDLIILAKSLGLKTSIITNGSRLTFDWLKYYGEFTDIIGISCDSSSESVQKAIGRGSGNSVRKALNSFKMINEFNESADTPIYTKLNTVVSRINFTEDMSEFVRETEVSRWKIFQVLHIKGENDESINELRITREEFMEFVNRHQYLKMQGLEIVPEDNEAMTESYLMINPEGSLYQNGLGLYSMSDTICKIGLKRALKQISFNFEKFLNRGGKYETVTEREMADIIL